MASLTIRRLDESVRSRLRVRAAQRGHSMEEEARQILKLALAGGPAGQRNLAESIRKRFAPLGGVELPGMAREPIRKPPKFRK
ncbi:MAG: plasmid stabilization protein [Acidobacteria bacterium]|nr:plasmid stabilization protein [Acidobacteriota bacterium]